MEEAPALYQHNSGMDLFYGRTTRMAAHETTLRSQNFPSANLYDFYPSLSPFYADFEKSPPSWVFDIFEFCIQNWEIPIIAVTLYMMLIFGMKAIMANRKPFALKTPLALWNLLLAVFSFMGAARTVPHLINTVATKGFYYSVCADSYGSYGHGSMQIWVVAFIFSKFPELIDTVFVVLRKKPLIFLHWYHHVTVLLYCWDAWSVMTSTGLYFIAMNYSVHAVMYFYYFCTSFGFVPYPAPMVTVFQLSQMFVGIYVVVSAWIYKQTSPCAVEDLNLYFAFAMYGSYALLFLNFFIRRFCCSKPRSATKDTKKVN